MVGEVLNCSADAAAALCGGAGVGEGDAPVKSWRAPVYSVVTTLIVLGLMGAINFNRLRAWPIFWLALFSVGQSLAIWLCFERAGFPINFHPMAFLILLVIGFFTPYIIHEAFAPIKARLRDPKFRLSIHGLGKIRVQPRVAIVVSMYLFVVYLSALMGIVSTLGLDVLSDGFYASWTQDVLFFGLLGSVVALVAQLSPSHEEFEWRVATMFPEAKSAAVIDNLSKEVKKLGFLVASVERRLIVKEFSSKYNAYKVEISLVNRFDNLFSDVDAERELNFGYTPDSFGASGGPIPSPIGEYISIIIDGEQKLTDGAVTIDQSGWKKSWQTKIPPEGIVATSKYWCWLLVGEDFDYKPSRFVAAHKTIIGNELECGSTITLDQVADNDQKRLSIDYGEEVSISKGEKLHDEEEYLVARLLAPGV